MKRCIFGLLLLISMPLENFSQQANIWYFGENAGLSFSAGSPVALSGGQINTTEGVASICDNSGAILFYTDGETVYNKQHAAMPNGTGLFGSFSSSQSAIIVPFINNSQKYYVFTVDQRGYPNGFNYSVVNMSLAGGLGDIEQKNIQLLTPVTEKLTAVKHCNGRDIWVIVHGWNSDAFYAYLVTDAGISSNPVISNSGGIHTGSEHNSFGCMKSSPDGSKLAVAKNQVGTDLFDFNNSTGVVSNPKVLFEHYETYRQPYGVEFSPNSKLLYVTAFGFDLDELKFYNNLLQYDVSLPDITSIINSKQVISRLDYIFQAYATLQTAPDGKIYMAQLTFPSLSVINNPNQYGLGCNFSSSSIPLVPGTRSTFGLPAFIQSYWDVGFSFTGACSSLTIPFSYSKPANISSIKWDFDDPSSGANNISTIENPIHTFSAPGLYNVKLIRFGVCGNDTIQKQVQAGTMAVNLGNDTVLCGSNPYELNPQTPGTNTYLWQNGTTTPTFPALQNGLYWVEVKNSITGCVKRDSIQLTFKPNPQVTLGADIFKCAGETVILSSSVSGATYLWNTGLSTNAIQVSQSGIYWLDATVDGCTKRDSINVVFNPQPMLYLGKDTVLCEGQTLLLDAQNTGAKYKWQDNSGNQTFTVSRSGNYYVNVNLNGCSTNDTIYVQYLLKPNFSLGRDTFICNGMQITLRPNGQNLNNTVYLWNDGSTAANMAVSSEGTYSLTLTNSCGSKYDEIKVSKGICKLYIPTAFTPNNDGLNDLFKVGYGENIIDYTMQIFNRYGELVFISKDKNKGWNGSFKNTNQPNGNYIWIIKYKTATDTIVQQLRGSVLLLR